MKMAVYLVALNFIGTDICDLKLNIKCGFTVTALCVWYVNSIKQVAGGLEPATRIVNLHDRVRLSHVFNTQFHIVPDFKP
jgi:hypothetical protein